MLYKEVKYWGLIILTLASCHSTIKKGIRQSVSKEDTIKPIVKKGIKKAPLVVHTILDTVVKKDTIKVVFYHDTMIRCSLNNLSDTFNVACLGFILDTFNYSDLSENIAPILIPGKKKPTKFILNDSLLIIPIIYGNVETMLFLLNRTKTSLKFARESGFEASFTASYYVYVDLKNNTILNHRGRIWYDPDTSYHGEEPGRYLVYRYRISNKHIMETNLVGCYFKEFERLDIDNNITKDVSTFYNIIVHRENWKHDTIYVPPD